MRQSLATERTIDAYPIKLPYPGAFHPNVDSKIRELIGTKNCIHLFSGSSKLGNIRVDIEHPNATHHMDVYNFITAWSGVDFRQARDSLKRPLVLLLDPDYEIERKDKKLNGHGLTASLSASVKHRKLFLNWVQKMGFEEIIYLDQCTPKIKGYAWEYWLVLTGGWHTNRILSHYIKTTQRLFN